MSKPLGNKPGARPEIFVFSAKTPAALRATAERYAIALEGLGPTLTGLCQTAACGRSHHNHRAAAVSTSVSRLQWQLAELAYDTPAQGTFRGTAAKTPAPMMLVLERNAQTWRTCLLAHEAFPQFAEHLTRSLDRLPKNAQGDVVQALNALREGGAEVPVDAALNVLGDSIAGLWRAWGADPFSIGGASQEPSDDANAAFVMTWREPVPSEDGAVAAVFSVADIAAQLFVRGRSLAWDAIYPRTQPPVQLPGYPFEEATHRHKSAARRVEATPSEAAAPTGLRALFAGVPRERYAEVVQDKLQKILAQFLVSPEALLEADQPLSRLGLTSLSALQLAGMVESEFGVAVPAPTLLAPTATLRHLSARLAQGALAEMATTCASIHGDGATEVRASDLRIERFIPRELIAGAAALPAAAESQRTVLLTGANGFLGRFLCLALLERLTEEGGRLICIVRAANDTDAAQRILGGLRGPDQLDVIAREHIQHGRLRVMAGDLMEPHLGVGADAYADLARSVDCIVHNGALVNHAYGYEQLFAPNVMGTAEVIRLALQGRRKAIGFVSTAGIFEGMPHNTVAREAMRAAEMWPTRPLADAYALGYATSKWACEILLEQLAEECKVPVSIFRCSMLLTHSKYARQFNPTDLFTRLLYSLIRTGVAPQSFYPTEELQRSHFDGVPVDFASSSIAAITLAASIGAQRYHVVNPHVDDMVSLDRIVEWMREAGTELEIVADYRSWFRLFHDRLQALPEKERNMSAWPTINLWEKPGYVAMWPVDASEMRARVRAVTSWEDVPRLSRDYVLHCLAGVKAHAAS